MKRLIVLVALSVLAPAAFAADAAKKPASVAGGWDMTVKGPPAHGDMAATLQLKQEGVKVTGTFTFTFNGKTQPLAGKLVDGALSLETTDTAADKALSFTAQLKDGALAGSVSTPMGDMRWTAVRAKETK
jgi:hypothetical protein